MTDEKHEHYQQQVLFEEATVENISITNESLPEQQLVINNDNWQALVTESQPQVSHEIAPAKPRWLWRIVGVLTISALSAEMVQFLQQGFIERPILTTIYATIFTTITLIAGAGIVKEWKNLRALKQQQQQRDQVNQLVNEGTPLNAKEFCQNITKQLSCDLQPEHEQQWQQVATENYNDLELMQLFDRIVLTPVDNKAIAEVAKFSSESVVLIALSPVALIDMLLMFWRNMRMIDKIAGFYGLRLGYWSRIKLIKQVFINMVYAGGSELIADLGTDLLGADMLGKLSARLAQGTGAGLLTARLGLKTIALCRPIPFQNEVPKMGLVRKEMLKQIKALVIKS
jgi:putative membrane protein